MLFRWLAYALALGALMLPGYSCGGGGSDDSFIEVLVTAPEGGQTDVPVATRIGFRIDANIDSASLTTETFFLTDEDGAVVPSTVFVREEPDTAELRPDAPLSVLTRFTATITTGLLSTDGASLEEDFAWGFTTLDSAWGTSEWLEEIGTGSSSEPNVGVDAELNALATWQYTDAVGDAIYASRYTRTDLWGEPELIDDGGGRSTNPRLAVSASGTGFAVWERGQNGSIATIWGNRYDVDDGWGAPELIQNDDMSPGRSPSIAVDPEGNAIAVWVERDITGVDNVIWANRYEAGSGWGSATSIDQMPTPVAGMRTAIGMNDSGNAIAIWARPQVSGEALWANRYVKGTGWLTAEAIKPDATTSAQGMQLAVGVGGDAFVVWVQGDGVRDDVWGLRFSGSSWGAPSRLDDYDGGNKQQPDVAVDRSGVAYAVWSQADPDFENIWATQYAPGSGWASPVLIEPPNEEPNRDADATNPRVAVNAAGNAFVVWRQNWLDWGSIWSNRLDPGTGWMTAELIEEIERAAGFPAIAVDDGRHAHAVWPHSESRGSDWLRTNRFE